MSFMMHGQNQLVLEIESRKIPTDYWRGKGVDPALQAMWQKWYR